MTRLEASTVVGRASRLALGLTLLLTATTANGAGRDRSAELVKRALKQEINGDGAERDAFLRAAIKESADYAAARWHSGFVRDGDRWLKFDQIPKSTADDATLAEYRRMRAKAPKTVDGLFRLADWCRRNGLREQERSHLTQLLEISPDHAEARRLLGFRRVGGVWMSEQERQDVQDRARRTLESVNRWRPRLEKALSQLVSGTSSQYRTGKSAVLAVNDPDAIPAMEQVLANQSQEAALLVVETLSKMSVYEAAIALARLAVFSPAVSVRAAAVGKLRLRNRQEYVPALLATMQTPIQSRAGLFQVPGRRLTYRHVFYREGQYNKRLATVDVEYNVPQSRSRFATRGDNINAARTANDTMRTREQMVARQNEIGRRLNSRVCMVLAAVTEQNLPASPYAWWQWWNDEEGVYVGDKPWDRAYVSSQVTSTPVSRPEITGGSSSSSGGARECLAAGTPVWTDRGPAAIETIQVGDRVLSQEPETGELAYKPVLRTTVRPAEPLVQVRLEGETIESSSGHPFWVSGKGWVLAKRLQPTARLHGITGTSAVRRVETGRSEPTYNLIVADFHTYFVGAAKVLSHDNTLRRPTNRRVPGLSGK